MGQSKCYSLMKGLLIIMNILFLVIGVGACAFSVWVLWAGVGSEETRRGDEPAAQAGLAALGAWGGALGGGAAAGLAGAARDSPPLLAGSFALLALAAAAEGAAAWWGAAHTPRLHAQLRDRLAALVTHDYGRVPLATQVMDTIQHDLDCCGAESARDWQKSYWSSRQPGSAPAPPAPAAAPAAAAPAAPAARATLDLSVGAEAPYYMLPESCCEAGTDATECLVARRVAAAALGGGGGGGGGGGVRAAACLPRVLAYLSRGARLLLAAGAALAAAHAAALLLTLAAAHAATRAGRYKA